ncbi:hypothetical protein STCU_01844 [Strigomonas culicis]|uniref:Yos1-like protein n=1 Tax=Strigomonas culicis TaxID=28005 RepID=S9UT56_9TRYP|nr:hypothetical protein STCU_01844 [Strigomonas culicis]|eukprot:EPY34127.1 hypothetical protein STCU_01844 [Strigomonas culicis]
MGFSIYSIFKSIVLMMNALAILSETRLLQKIGLASTATQQRYEGGNQGGLGDNGGGDGGFAAFETYENAAQKSVSISPLKTQIAALLSSVRMLLRWPLVFVNVVLIVLAFILG